MDFFKPFCFFLAGDVIEPLEEKLFKAVSFGGFKHSTPFEYLFVFLDLNKTVAFTFFGSFY